MPTLFRRLRALVSRDCLDHELDEEMQHHLDRLVARPGSWRPFRCWGRTGCRCSRCRINRYRRARTCPYRRSTPAARDGRLVRRNRLFGPAPPARFRGPESAWGHDQRGAPSCPGKRGSSDRDRGRHRPGAVDRLESVARYHAVRGRATRSPDLRIRDGPSGVDRGGVDGGSRLARDPYRPGRLTPERVSTWRRGLPASWGDRRASAVAGAGGWSHAPSAARRCMLVGRDHELSRRPDP